MFIDALNMSAPRMLHRQDYIDDSFPTGALPCLVVASPRRALIVIEDIQNDHHRRSAD